MTSSSDLQRKLVSGLKESLAESAQPSDAYAEVLELLRAFAAQVRAALASAPKSEDAKLDVVVERGHLVNAGLEHRVVVRAPVVNLQDFLLRAYVPIDGYPVTIDAFGDEEQEYDTPGALVNALIELPRHPDMKARLAVMRQVLSDASQYDVGPPAPKPRATKKSRAAG